MSGIIPCRGCCVLFECPNINDKIQFPKLCGYSVAEHKSSIVPLYRWDQNKIRDFVGTGTLIQYQGKHLLISCAHCFDRGGEHEVTVGSADEFSIDRPVLTTQLPPEVDRNHDPVDFAVVLLKTNEIVNLATHSTFIPEGAIEGQVVEEWSDDFGIMGFPARDNDVDLVNRKIPANAVELPARKAAKFSDQRTRKNPHWYLPLTFEPKKLQPLIQSDIHIESPEGLSGSPIFRYAYGMRSLAGIVIEHIPGRKRQALLGLYTTHTHIPQHYLICSKPLNGASTYNSKMRWKPTC